MRNTCRIDGCDGLCKGQGLCFKHYERVRRHGDPLREPGKLKSKPAPPGAKVCSVEDCDRRAEALGWCGTHYMRWRKHGDALAVLDKPGRKAIAFQCSVEGCDRGGPYTRGFCRRHYTAWRQHGDPLGRFVPKNTQPCTVAGCDQLIFARGLCTMHYARWKEYGDPGESTPRRKAAGEGHIDAWGYHKVRHVKVHRTVMAEILGRELRPNEDVHHINGIRSDNRPENLELWVTSHPRGQRVDDLVRFVVDNYKEQVMQALTEGNP